MQFFAIHAYMPCAVDVNNRLLGGSGLQTWDTWALPVTSACIVRSPAAVTAALLAH